MPPYATLVQLLVPQLLTPVLSAAGYTVTTRGCAAEAIKLIEGGLAFDAVVTDTDMPDMDGYTFARALRAMQACRRTPIIALAAQANDKAMKAARASGIDAVAGKFDRKLLLETLADALDRAELGGQMLEDRIIAESAA